MDRRAAACEGTSYRLRYGGPCQVQAKNVILETNKLCGQIYQIPSVTIVWPSGKCVC